MDCLWDVKAVVTYSRQGVAQEVGQDARQVAMGQRPIISRTVGGDGVEWSGMERRAPWGHSKGAHTRGVRHPECNNGLLSCQHCQGNNEDKDTGPYVAVRPPWVELTRVPPRAPPPQICDPIHARQGAAKNGDRDWRAVHFPPAPVVTGQ